MNISKQLQNLHEDQQKSLVRILKILQDGKKLKVEDCGFLGFRLDACKQNFILKLFRITRPTINAWEQDGCPRNADGSYNAPAVQAWRASLDKESKTPADRADLETEKLRLQCEKLEGDIRVQKEQSISKEDHLQAFNDLIGQWKHYWMEIFKRNLHLFAGKTTEQLRPLADKLVRDSFNNVTPK